MKMDVKTDILAKKPKWIKVKLPIGKKYTELRSLVEKKFKKDLDVFDYKF